MMWCWHVIFTLQTKLICSTKLTFLTAYWHQKEGRNQRGQLAGDRSWVVQRANPGRPPLYAAHQRDGLIAFSPLADRLHRSRQRAADLLQRLSQRPAGLRRADEMRAVHANEAKLALLCQRLQYLPGVAVDRDEQASRVDSLSARLPIPTPQNRCRQSVFSAVEGDSML